ncbi:hypothetical protein EAH80_28265 [Mycobacterium hodleri]|uniref:Uncharacterized protein n=2 Tax=Mycolicibacterium hodleri TaxID=49897 RepID=A0A502DU80_9MYCO|nr:hypothetical protein EAH80_28265 [Mycolicibacterium hodleri]
MWIPAVSRVAPQQFRGGYGTLFVALHKPSFGGKAKPHVEVRNDDRRVRQLTPSMSQRLLPMIKHLWGRELVAA